MLPMKRYRKTQESTARTSRIPLPEKAGGPHGVPGRPDYDDTSEQLGEYDTEAPNGSSASEAKVDQDDASTASEA